LEIKIFVVKTEITTEIQEAELKNTIKTLVKTFEGLTQIPFSGFWLNEQKQIEEDNGKIWLIYTTHEIDEREKEAFDRIMLQIKATTKQKIQAYAINNEMFFV